MKALPDPSIQFVVPVLKISAYLVLTVLLVPLVLLLDFRGELDWDVLLALFGVLRFMLGVPFLGHGLVIVHGSLELSYPGVLVRSKDVHPDALEVVDLWQRPDVVNDGTNDALETDLKTFPQYYLNNLGLDPQLFLYYLVFGVLRLRCQSLVELLELFARQDVVPEQSAEKAKPIGIQVQGLCHLVKHVFQSGDLVLEGHLEGVGGEESGRGKHGVLGVVGHDSVVAVLPAEGHHFLTMVIDRVQLKRRILKY